MYDGVDKPSESRLVAGEALVEEHLRLWMSKVWETDEEVELRVSVQVSHTKVELYVYFPSFT